MAFAVKRSELRMRDVRYKVLMLSFLLFFANLCVSEQAGKEYSLDLHERAVNSGGIEQRQGKIPNENKQPLTNNEDALNSNDPQMDGQPLR